MPLHQFVVVVRINGTFMTARSKRLSLFENHAAIFHNALCMANIDMPVYCAKSGDEMGKISKIYKALLTEFLSNADEYRINFNPGLDLTSKILFIAAAIVIDIMVFDSDDNPCCACLPCLCSCACCCVSKKKERLARKD